MSAVVGRRNNWLLSPGKFPDQFLFMIDKNKKLFSSTEQETSKRGKENGEKKKKKSGLGKQTQAKEGERWRQRAEGRGRLASHLTRSTKACEASAEFLCVSVYQQIKLINICL